MWQALTEDGRFAGYAMQVTITSFTIYVGSYPHLYSSEPGGYPGWGWGVISSDVVDLSFAYFLLLLPLIPFFKNIVECLHFIRTYDFVRKIHRFILYRNFVEYMRIGWKP